MKTFKYFLLVALLPVCNSAFAQYDNEGYYHPEYEPQSQARYTDYHQTYYEDYTEDWGIFYLEYSPLQLVSTARGVDNKLFHTATIGYSYVFQLGDSPVYLDAGLETSGSWFSKRYNDGTKYSMDVYHSKIPVDVVFRWNFSENFAIAPYAGMYLRYNIYGEEREKDSYGNTQTWELFNSEYTNDDDYNRFQFGYQAGLRLIIGGCISIGAAWKQDLSSFCTYYDDYTRKEEKEKFQGFTFSLAYCF
jgi:hypothetical protein